MGEAVRELGASLLFRTGRLTTAPLRPDPPWCLCRWRRRYCGYFAGNVARLLGKLAFAGSMQRGQSAP
jgi:hypothetical protein